MEAGRTGGHRDRHADDLRALELLAETLATETEAREILATEGLTARTADGGMKSHPAARIMETARSQAARLLIEFGLMPKGRPAPPPRRRRHGLMTVDDIDRWMAKEARKKIFRAPDPFSNSRLSARRPMPVGRSTSRAMVDPRGG